MDKPDSKRMSLSRECLHDARCENLSLSTRLVAAWEAIYLCCCEVVSVLGSDIDGFEHPSAVVVESYLRAVYVPPDERERVETMFQWALERHQLRPVPFSVEDACELAAFIKARTVVFLWSMP